MLAASLLVWLPAPTSAETIRLLTYNVWHGFWRTPAKELMLLPSEAAGERARRTALQTARLKRLQPEILMGQEVHPLPWRGRDLERALDHDSIHQLVSCGLRFLHVGVPWSIRSGLLITARPEFELSRVAAPRLSGRWGYCNDWLGLQLEETRRALIGRIVLSDGRTLLLVTTHLYSSTEGGSAREDRRVQEVLTLLDTVAELRRNEPEIFGVILGGDFNALESSESIARLTAAGFVDTAAVAGAEFVTYDPWSNLLAARMTKAGGGDPVRSAPRRIDYVFVSEEIAPFVRSVGPYGLETEGSSESEFDSDHYGVVVELEL